MLVLLGALGVELLLPRAGVARRRVFRNRAASQAGPARHAGTDCARQKSKAEREEILSGFLPNACGLVRPRPDAGQGRDVARGTDIAAAVFAAVYRNREAALAARFDADLYVLEPYPGAGWRLQTEQEVSESGEGRTRQVGSTGARKTSACRRTQDHDGITMSRMLNEYSTMFSGAPPERGEARPGDSMVAAPPDDEMPAGAADQADDMPVG